MVGHRRPLHLQMISMRLMHGMRPLHLLHLVGISMCLIMTDASRLRSSPRSLTRFTQTRDLISVNPHRMESCITGMTRM